MSGQTDVGRTTYAPWHNIYLLVNYKWSHIITAPFRYICLCFPGYTIMWKIIISKYWIVNDCDVYDKFNKFLDYSFQKTINCFLHVHKILRNIIHCMYLFKTWQEKENRQKTFIKIFNSKFSLRYTADSKLIISMNKTSDIYFTNEIFPIIITSRC